MKQVLPRHVSALSAAVFCTMGLCLTDVRDEGAKLLGLLQEVTISLQNLNHSPEMAEQLAWLVTLFAVGKWSFAKVDVATGDFPVPKRIQKTDDHFIPHMPVPRPMLDKISMWSATHTSQAVPKFSTALEFLRAVMKNAGEDFLCHYAAGHALVVSWLHLAIFPALQHG